MLSDEFLTTTTTETEYEFWKNEIFHGKLLISMNRIEGFAIDTAVIMVNVSKCDILLRQRIAENELQFVETERRWK